VEKENRPTAKKPILYTSPNVCAPTSAHMSIMARSTDTFNAEVAIGPPNLPSLSYALSHLTKRALQRTFRSICARDDCPVFMVLIAE
jgi:hypothetical protein